MSTAATILPQSTPRPSAAAHQAPPPTASLDPVKLIMRNKWILLASVVLGLGVGLVGHFVWMKVYPFYKPTALFNCNPPESNIWNVTGAAGVTSQDEMTMFMQTQVKLMTSVEVLDKVAQDPNLATKAPYWSAMFKGSDGQINASEVLKELQDEMRARTLPQTSLVELSFTWRKSEDAAGVVNMVMQEYLALVKRRNDDAFKDRSSLLTQAWNDSGKEIDRLRTRRAALIRENKIDTDDPRLSAAVRELDLASKAMSDITQIAQEVRIRIQAREEELNDPSGYPRYNDEIKAIVSQKPEILNIKQQITALEAEVAAMTRRGITDKHRQYAIYSTRLEGYRAQLESAQSEGWAREFQSQYQDLQLRKRSLDAQAQELSAKIDELKIKQTEITQVVNSIKDIDEQIRQKEMARTEDAGKLKDLNAIISLPTAKRIMPLQDSVRAPKDPTFPQMVFMIPAGAVLCLALTAGFIVLREVVDQRIKSPADINLLPRTKLLGWVADAEEDPAGPGAVETAFRDRNRGVLAENFRQIRSVLLKKMEISGHKVVVVTGCMPSSGATSVVSNLALACAAAGRRVLVIDANFRRPAMHRVFGVPDGPGLGDVLAAASTFDAAVRDVPGNPRLSVLPVGGKEHRVYEALSNEGFNSVLNDARARFDIILVDVSPAVVSGDAVSVANKADASFLVARAFSEKRGMIARIRSELSEAHGEFLGVLVNGVKSSAGGYLKGNIRTAHEYHNEAAA